MKLACLSAYSHVTYAVHVILQNRLITSLDMVDSYLFIILWRPPDKYDLKIKPQGYGAVAANHENGTCFETDL